MARFEKHFTLESARRWLPKLRKRFRKIHELYSELEPMQEEFVTVQTRIRMNGHAPKPTEFEKRVMAVQAIVKEIIDAGIEVKDIERGLVDFPHWRDGEEVFLCWELADDDIGYWHGVEEGFPGRRPI